MNQQCGNCSSNGIGNSVVLCSRHANVDAIERDVIVFQQTIKGIQHDRETLERERDERESEIQELNGLIRLQKEMLRQADNNSDELCGKMNILSDRNVETENDRDVLMAKLESARRTNAELVAALEKIGCSMFTSESSIVCATGDLDPEDWCIRCAALAKAKGKI